MENLTRLARVEKNIKIILYKLRELNKKIQDISVSVIDNLTSLSEILSTHTSDKNNPHSVTKAQIGLSNVDNTSDLNKPISTATQTALDSRLNKGGYTGTAQDLKNAIDNIQVGVVDTSNLVPYTGANKDVNIGAYYFETSQGFKKTGGTANQALTADGGVFNLNTKADLVGGKVPVSQLPAYVDDVLEFANLASFPATGESGKIYIALDTNLTYRWGGSSYVVMSSSLALGETSSTAYRGDRGKIAYDHSQTTGNPHNTTKNDIGLGNVPNLDTTNAVNNSHTHSNKSILDLITEPFITSLKSLYDGAVTSINNLLLTGQRLITSGEITKLSNISGTNTGDETTSSIQTKRPLKTIEGQSLEGSGNINLTSNDVGLGNVDNTSDLNKPISTATQTALDSRLNKGSYPGTASDLKNEIDGKANTSHTHNISDVTNLQTALDNKQNTIGYTPENAANKATDLSSPDNTKYPTTLAVANENKKATITVELISQLTTNFYAPNALRINSTALISGSGTLTLKVNDVAYTLGNLIPQGAKITAETSSSSVYNLISIYE